MNILAVQRFGKWTMIITLCVGTLLISHYLITREVESGTLLYFYIVFAGIVNAITLLIVLFTSFIRKKNKKQSLIISALILISYLALLTVAYFLF
jgi:hypothetical protein